jgi:hypothetical protein
MEQSDQQFKIDHVALENYLLSIKDSIQNLTEEIRHPVWWDSLKSDVDKVVELGRKVDHNQIDINSLRNILYGKNISYNNNTQSVNNNNIQDNNIVSVTDDSCENKDNKNNNDISNKNVKHDKSSYELNELEIYKNIPKFPMQFIFAELEGMRLLIRRIEVHQSSDVQLFGQVKHLQSQMRNMLRLYDPKLAEKGLANIRHEVTQQIHNIKLLIKQNNEIQPISEKIEGRLNLIEENILNLSKNNNLLENTLNKGFNNEVQEVLLKIQKKQSLYEQDFQLFKKKIKIMDQIKSSKLILNIFIKYDINKLKMFFKTWSKLLLLEKFKISENVPAEFNDIIIKYDVLRLKLVFKNWHYAIFKKEEYQRLYILRKRILSKWHAKSIPKINPYFKHWKRFSVVTRKRVNLNLKVNEKENPIDSLKHKFEDLEQDVEGRMMLIQDYTVKLLHNNESNESKLNNFTNTMKTFVNSDQMNCDIKSYFEDSLVLFENQLVKISKSTDAKMLRERDNFEKKLRETTDEVDESKKSFQKLKVFVNSFDDRFNAQDKKIERILLLQGNILERIEGVEDVQANFMDSKTGFTDLIMDVKSVKSEIIDVTKQISDTQNYFQEALDIIDTKSNKNIKNIHGLSNYNKTLISDFKNLDTNLQSRMKGLEHSLKHRLPPNPTPDELYSIANSFETKYIQKNKEGKYTDIMNLQIADKLSKFTHRLSIYISNTADMEIISSIIIKCGKDSGAEVNIDNSRKNSVLLKRKEIIDIFINDFTNIVNLSDKTGPPGILKLNARTIFLRQFKKALDISFTKLEIIQVSSPVSIVRTKIGPDTITMKTNNSTLRPKLASPHITNYSDKINSNNDKSNQLQETHSSNPNHIKYLSDFQSNFSTILSMLPKTSETALFENNISFNNNLINNNYNKNSKENEDQNIEIIDSENIYNDPVSYNIINEISNNIINTDERNVITTQTTSSIIHEGTKENNNTLPNSRQNSLEKFSCNNSSTDFNEIVANMIMLDNDKKPDLVKSKRSSSAGSIRVKDAHLIRSVSTNKNIIIGEANLTGGDELVIKRRIIPKKFNQIY